MYILTKTLPLNPAIVLYKTNQSRFDFLVNDNGKSYFLTGVTRFRYKATVYRWRLTAFIGNFFFGGKIERVYVTL